MSKYIILTTRNEAVVAPTGYALEYGTGRIYKDSTPSPELGPMGRAYQFDSHRSAARTASKLVNPLIREIEQ